MPSARSIGAGVFVLTGLVLFALALFLIGERRMLFEDRFTVYAEFAMLSGLQPGATVRVGGMDAGEVTDILIPRTPGQPFRVQADVREDLHRLIRTDSLAQIRTEGLVGGQFLQIAPGSESAPPLPDGGTIPSREPFDFADALEKLNGTIDIVNETILRLRADVEKALAIITETTVDIDQLVREFGDDLNEMTSSGRAIVQDVEAIVEDVRAGKGSIGRLLAEDTLYVRATEIAQEARRVMENVNAVTAEARKTVASFNAKEGDRQPVAVALRDTLERAREVLSNLAETSEALKRNWFFRGFFERRGYYNLARMSPAEYREGALEQEGRQALRIWLDAALLFETGANGTLRLTPGGVARVESALGEFIEYQGAGPLVIEGYAQEGAPSQQYLLAKQRAETVRDYLVRTFDLEPATVGVMPLGGRTLGDPPREAWDGIALALFIDRKSLAGGR